MRKILVGVLALFMFVLVVPVKVSAQAVVNCSFDPVTRRVDGFTLSGHGCPPNQAYTLTVAISPPGSVTTRTLSSDALGSFSYSYTDPLLQGVGYNIDLRNNATGADILDLPMLPLAATPAPNPVPTSAAGGTISGSCGASGIDTAIGCVPINDQNALIGFFLRWGLGIGGGIAFLLIVLSGFQIMTSRGDPNRLKAGQELMTSAIAGLLLLIFSLIILRVIGFDILSIGAFQ